MFHDDTTAHSRFTQRSYSKFSHTNRRPLCRRDFGAGGYTEAILNAAPDVRVIAIDQDETAVAAGQSLVQQYAPRLTLIHGRFGDMADLVSTPVDGVVLDIGVSSMQIDRPERGFSFQKDGPLDMRMGQTGQTAADVVNTFKESDLADILYEYGEEKASRRIARKIVQRRQEKPFQTTLDLADVIRSCLPRKPGDTDPATRSFQALRIYVNDELGELKRGLTGAQSLLKAGGILAVVSFHSLEDRIVKNFMAQESGHVPNPSKYMPEVQKKAPSFEILTKKPITPSPAELSVNPRARSSRLRAARRLS